MEWGGLGRSRFGDGKSEQPCRHAVATGATDSSNGTKNDQYGRNTFLKQD